MSTFEEQVAALVAPGADRAAAGVTLFCGTSDGLVYQKTIGTASVSPDSPPLSPDAIAPMASCSKLITSIACLQCVERGLLTLDGDAAEIMPQLRGMKVLRGFKESSGEPILEELTSKITLRRLLSHTSGFAYSFTSPDVMRYTLEVLKVEPMSVMGDIEKMIQAPLVFQPGEEGFWSYGIGIDVAGKLVELVNGGIKLGDYCQKNIWGPLGINDLVYRFDGRQDLLAKMAPLTVRKDGILVDAGVEFKEPKDDWGGGGLLGSGPGYFKVLLAVFNESNLLLAPSTWAQIYVPQVIEPPQPNPMTISMILAEFQRNAPTGTSGAPTFRWGYGLMCSILQTDVPVFLRKGTLHWGGMRNCTWFIDHESGIVTFLWTHLLPFEDPPIVKIKTLFHQEMIKRFGKK